MAARPIAVTWAAGFAGAFLIYAAITNRSPLSSLSGALTGSPLRSTIGTGGVVAPVAGNAGPAAPDGGTGTAAPALTSIAGGHRLAPAAAVAYNTASAMFGRPIPLTDSYRTPAQQAQCNAAKPDLCTTPDKSWHVKGLAIDVNGPKAGGYENPRLVTALTATGWQRYAPVREPWHWSFGGRG